MGYHQITPPGISLIAEQLIFKTLWDRLPKKSFVTGLWLRSYVNTPLWNNCFLHVLPVKQYPYFKYLYANILLVTPAEKAIYEQCTPESLIHYALEIEEKSKGASTANWGAVRELEEELKVLYKKHFPSTRGMFLNYTYTLQDQERIIGKLNREFWRDFK